MCCTQNKGLTICFREDPPEEEDNRGVGALICGEAPGIQAARDLAQRKGLPYQTYMKMLLHEALEKERRTA
jgi:uracil-DNA glycosylase